MAILAGLQSQLEIASELLRFFWSHKWWWITPMVAALLLFGMLLVFVQSSAIAPFI